MYIPGYLILIILLVWAMNHGWDPVKEAVELYHIAKWVLIIGGVLIIALLLIFSPAIAVATYEYKESQPPSIPAYTPISMPVPRVESQSIPSSGLPMYDEKDHPVIVPFNQAGKKYLSGEYGFQTGQMVLIKTRTGKLFGHIGTCTIPDLEAALKGGAKIATTEDVRLVREDCESKNDRVCMAVMDDYITGKPLLPPQ